MEVWDSFGSTEWFVIEPPTESLGAKLSRWSGEILAYFWGGLFGPDDRTRALSVMSQCLLVLIVLRRVE